MRYLIPCDWMESVEMELAPEDIYTRGDGKIYTVRNGELIDIIEIDEDKK